MTQLSGNQFEDDLTVGADESHSIPADSMDLFGAPGDEDSPIAKLKAIILSIDWEINDEILQQLEDELVDLADIWSADKIKLIYVQGLSKIGKYIFKERASAHPDAIKLLITFYRNLEQIVSGADGSMSDDEKKKLLLADVKKFDRLKGEIAQSEAAAPSQATQEPAPAAALADTEEGLGELKALKAQVLGIDWEINDQELHKLGDEVKRLMALFKEDKAKLVLLQGIGALSAYINKMRSKSNSNVFTLLHSFCNTLEQVSGTQLSADQSKQLLLAEVAKFKEFKADIGKETPADSGQVTVATDSPASLAPAASLDESEPDAAEDEELGEDEVECDVSSRLSSVFGDEDVDEIPLTDVEESSALEGVNVETEADDDSDEDALPYEDGAVAPALADAEVNSSFSVEKLAGDLAVAAPSVAPEPIVGDDFFADNEDEEVKLQGVDVETEADDDSDEDVLPTEGGALSPALSGADDEMGFDAEEAATDVEEAESDDIESRLGSFFDDEVETSSAGWKSESDEPSPALVDEEDTELQGIDVESEADDDSEEDVLPTEDGELAPALSASDDEMGFDAGEVGSDLEGTESDAIESRLGSFFDDEVETSSAGWASESDDLDTADDEERDDDGIAPAFSDTPADVVFDAVEDEIQEDRPVAVAFDEHEEQDLFEEEPEAEEVSPILPEDDESPVLLVEEHEVIEQEEESVEQLFEEPEEEPAAESVDEELSFLDDKEDDDEDDQTDELFADTETEEIEDVVEEVAEEVTEETSEEAFEFDDAVEDVEEEDELEFTLPGEDVAAVATAVAAASVVGVLSGQDEDDDALEFHDSDTLEEEDEKEEIVFEAVDDDVELDLLPGEEYVDSESSDDLIAKGIDETDDDEVMAFAVDEDSEESLINRYESLAILTSSLQQNVTEETVQDMLAEMNRLRSSEVTDHTEKMFMQLLSTTCQNVQNDGETSEYLSLIDGITSGLVKSGAGETSSDVIQEELLQCTSHLLQLQQRQMNVPSAEPSSLPEVNQHQVDSFQNELADLRKLFVDEIGALRKELIEK